MVAPPGTHDFPPMRRRSSALPPAEPDDIDSWNDPSPDDVDDQLYAEKINGTL